ncbi:MAG: tail fiber domain-containing protein, partial [Bacteroidia bacterium]
RTVENGTIGGWSRIDAGATTYANLAGIPTRTAWSGIHRGFVAEQLSWKNYGNSHTIFDASAGTSPDGGAVNNTNAQVAWSASYPTLMGWNGANTYGVRVDVARVADNVAWTGVTGRPTALSSFTNDLGNYGGWIPNNGSGDWQIASNSNATSYSQSTLELRETNFAGAGQQPPRLGFHWGGVVASQIAIESDGTIAIRNNPGTAYEKFKCLTMRSNGFIEPSDERLKKNITPIGGALDKIMALQGVTYNWRTDMAVNQGLDDGKQYGLIAQELEKIIPELVDTDKEGWKAVEYSHLVPVLIEAIKEQQSTIEKQQQTINSQQQIITGSVDDITFLKQYTKQMEAKINMITGDLNNNVTGNK